MKSNLKTKNKNGNLMGFIGPISKQTKDPRCSLLGCRKAKSLYCKRPTREKMGPAKENVEKQLEAHVWFYGPTAKQCVLPVAVHTFRDAFFPHRKSSN